MVDSLAVGHGDGMGWGKVFGMVMMMNAIVLVPNPEMRWIAITVSLCVTVGPVVKLMSVIWSSVSLGAFDDY